MPAPGSRRYSCIVTAQSWPGAPGGSHHIGTQFRVRPLISSFITERSARNTPPCATTSTAGGCRTARLRPATVRRRNSKKLSAPSGVVCPGDPAVEPIGQRLALSDAPT